MTYQTVWILSDAQYYSTPVGVYSSLEAAQSQCPSEWEWSKGYDNSTGDRTDLHWFALTDNGSSFDAQVEAFVLDAPSVFKADQDGHWSPRHNILRHHLADHEPYGF